MLTGVVVFNIFEDQKMKNLIKFFTIILSAMLVLPSISIAAPDKEKAFLDSYKKAFESKDEATLKGFLYTKGADPEILEFYTMMMTGEMGGKISSIELKDLSPDDVKKANAIQPSPSGENVKLTLAPTKKLVIKVASSNAGGTSTSSSETFVAEADGKYVIPVPGPVK